MDFTTPRYFQSHVVNGEPPLERANIPSFYVKTQKNDTNTNNNPFAETFPDPLCKLNLKETSEFVKSFPMPENSRVFPRREGVNSVTVTQRRLAADLAPPTPGRPVFGFSSASPGNFPRKSFPSKWDDAEKWLISTSCHDSPAHSHLIKSPEHSLRVSRQSDNNVNNIISGINAKNNNNNGFKQQIEVFSDKSRVTEEKVSKAVPNIHNSSSSCSASSVRGFNGSTDVLLKDKFTDDIEPTKEACLFKNSACEAMRDAGTEMGRRSVEHRDVGTEMTPLGSSTTSRCHTPFKSSSPARHNTPANRSGPLGLGHSDRTNSATIDIAQLQECHLAKLQLGTHYDSVTSNWSSREEEEEEISKSLRHFETDNGCYKNFSNNAASNNDSRAVVWEEEEKTKCCSRYQREEAKIQAWVNLQSAKAEAQSRKLEVKIQKMRSNLEEKLMKRMAEVHRKAEEWRASARQQHSEQMKKATENAHKMSNNRTRSHFSTHTTASCGCFPCNHNHYRS